MIPNSLSLVHPRQDSVLWTVDSNKHRVTLLPGGSPPGRSDAARSGAALSTWSDTEDIMIMMTSD